MSEIRGIVLESGKGWAVILLRNGEYRRVRTLHALMPGEIYHGKPPLNYGKLTAAAAVFLMIFVGVVDFFNVVAYAEVSSGLEMGVNRWNRVVTVSAVNSEGEMLMDELNIKGQNLEAALETILEKALVEENSSDSPQITVSIKNANDKPLPPGIAKKVDGVIAQDGINDYDLIQLQVDEENKEQKIYGLTVKDKIGKGHQTNKDHEDTGSSDTEPANAADNGKNENYQNGRNKNDQLNNENTESNEDLEDTEKEKVKPNKSDKADKNIPDQALDKIPTE